MTNSDRLQEIRERADKATPGPWACWDGWGPISGGYLDGFMGMARIGPSGDPREVVHASSDAQQDIYAKREDAEFIAASREDIPYLLQLVTEQQREIDRYRKALEAVNEFANEDDICTHKTIGAQHGWGACFVCLIQATAQGALRGENGPFESDDEPEAKGYRKQERPI